MSLTNVIKPMTMSVRIFLSRDLAHKIAARKGFHRFLVCCILGYIRL